MKKLRWFDVYSELNVDAAVSILTAKLNGVLDRFAPVKTIQVRPNYAPWMNDKVKAAISIKHSSAQTLCLYYINEKHLRNLPSILQNRYILEVHNIYRMGMG